MPDDKSKKRKKAIKKVPPKKTPKPSADDRAPEEPELTSDDIPEPATSDHRFEPDPEMSRDQLLDLRAETDYSYTCAKAQLKLFERQLCNRVFCMNCRMAKAGVRAKLLELESVQADIAKALNGMG